MTMAILLHVDYLYPPYVIGIHSYFCYKGTTLKKRYINAKLVSDTFNMSWAYC